MMLAMASANSLNEDPALEPQDIVKLSTVPASEGNFSAQGVVGIENQQPHIAPGSDPTPTKSGGPSLIGVLPNGVHVSRVVGTSSYNQEIQTALKKVLPTTTEAIRAFSFTTQLALQYIMNIKSAQLLAQNRPILPREVPAVTPLPQLIAGQPPDAANPMQTLTATNNLSAAAMQILMNPTAYGLKPLDPGSLLNCTGGESLTPSPSGSVLNCTENKNTGGTSDSSLNPVNNQEQKTESQHLRTAQVETVCTGRGCPGEEHSQQLGTTTSHAKVITMEKKRKGNLQIIADSEKKHAAIHSVTPISTKKKHAIKFLSDRGSQEHDGKISMYRRKRKQEIQILEDSSSTKYPKKSRRRPNHKHQKKSSIERPVSKRPCLREGLHRTGSVRRMASLNARARVSALMEPERKLVAKPIYSASKKLPTEKVLNEDTITAALSQLAQSGSLPAGEYVAIHHPEVEAPPQFNTAGLLYNGSTIHPTAVKVFYSNVNEELVLPKRVLPIIVPTKINTIGSEIKKSLAMHHSHKTSKSNNGWITIGSPVKTIEYMEGDVATTRKFYIGIQRKRDRVFVRDCVALRAGKDVKPYIGKIASIWREQDGLMMTIFWYYRPEEINTSGTIGLEFRKNELLASQHYDVNSVACIEEKCYILGSNQFCRYHARVNASKFADKLHQMSLVPPLPSRDNQSMYVSHDHMTKDGTSHDLNREYVDLGPSMDRLVQTESSLVYLCYRGYNHITGRIYQL